MTVCGRRHHDHVAARMSPKRGRGGESLSINDGSNEGLSGLTKWLSSNLDGFPTVPVAGNSNKSSVSFLHLYLKPKRIPREAGENMLVVIILHFSRRV